MKTRYPLSGLLKYSFHSASGSLAVILISCLAVGILLIITEHHLIESIFSVIAFGGFAFVVIMKSEGTSKWEQFQIAMPVKRKDVAIIPYLSIFLASSLGIPIFFMILGVRFFLSGEPIGLMLSAGFAFQSTILSTTLLTAALLYPLACTKVGSRSESGLLVICTIFAIVINGTILVGGNNLGLSDTVVTLMNLTVSGAAFIVSLFITRAIYAKIDF